MTTLITGGSGFIGSNLDGDIKASRADADLTQLDETLDYFADVKPSVVIHAAAKHGNYAQMRENRVEYYRDNILINVNVFEAAKRVGVKNLLAFSSVTAFPDNLTSFNEADLYSGAPHDSAYAYAYSKRMIDVLARAYRDDYKLNYNCVFLANAYGPFGKENVVPLLIKRCMNAIQNNVPFEVDGDGNNMRDLVFVRDLRKITKRLVELPPFGSLIVSSGSIVSIRELVNEIVTALEYKDEVVWFPERDTGQKKKIPSNDRLKQLLPNSTFTNLQVGIQKTVEWHVLAQNCSVY